MSGGCLRAQISFEVFVSVSLFLSILFVFLTYQQNINTRLTEDALQKEADASAAAAALVLDVYDVNGKFFGGGLTANGFFVANKTVFYYGAKVGSAKKIINNETPGWQT